MLQGLVCYSLRVLQNETMFWAPLEGVEPTLDGVEDQRTIHYATRANICFY
jgi:hypothetical protein